MDAESGAEFDQPSGEGRSQVMAAGFVLLGLGLFALLFLAQEILAMYDNPVSHKFVVNIAKPLADAKVMFDDHEITINGNMALASGVVIFLMLAWVGVSIAGQLLKTGARLLSPDVHRELAKLSRQLAQLQNRADKAPRG